MMTEDIKLTHMTKTAGWAAKIGPGTLAQVLGNLPKFHDENLLVGVETSDDAAIYKVNNDLALIQTLDFFTPIVDDPYLFGQIAAANSLSDVYAMGGEPKTALNIVGFPNCLDPKILGRILEGGASKVKESGAILAGGHSIQDDEPKYGLSVTGFVNPNKIFKNYGSKPGDVIILTKQIGSGLINTAIKAEMAEKSQIDEVVTVMTSLNKKAKEVIENYNISACTDITGFGLAGHAMEMASSSNVTFEIDVQKVPYIDGAMDFAKMGLVPAGTYSNKDYISNDVNSENIEECFTDVLYDPQTSGGLLITIPESEVKNIMKDFEDKNMDTKVAIIGRVIDKQEKSINLIKGL